MAKRLNPTREEALAAGFEGTDTTSIWVKSADNLTNMDWNLTDDMTDAFIEVSLHNGETKALLPGTEVLKTRIIDDDLNPEWDEVLEFPVQVKIGDMIKFKIVDSDYLKDDDPIGEDFQPCEQFAVGNYTVKELYWDEEAQAASHEVELSDEAIEEIRAEKAGESHVGHEVSKESLDQPVYLRTALLWPEIIINPPVEEDEDGDEDVEPRRQISQRAGRLEGRKGRPNRGVLKDLPEPDDENPGSDSRTLKLRHRVLKSQGWVQMRCEGAMWSKYWARPEQYNGMHSLCMYAAEDLKFVDVDGVEVPLLWGDQERRQRDVEDAEDAEEAAKASITSLSSLKSMASIKSKMSSNSLASLGSLAKLPKGHEATERAEEEGARASHAIVLKTYVRDKTEFEAKMEVVLEVRDNLDAAAKLLPQVEHAFHDILGEAEEHKLTMLRGASSSSKHKLAHDIGLRVGLPKSTVFKVLSDFVGDELKMQIALSLVDKASEDDMCFGHEKPEHFRPVKPFQMDDDADEGYMNITSITGKEYDFRVQGDAEDWVRFSVTGRASL